MNTQNNTIFQDGPRHPITVAAFRLLAVVTLLISVGGCRIARQDAAAPMLYICLDDKSFVFDPLAQTLQNMADSPHLCLTKSPDESTVLTYEPSVNALRLIDLKHPETKPKDIYLFSPKDSGEWHHRWLDKNLLEVLILSSINSTQAFVKPPCAGKLPTAGNEFRCGDDHRDIYYLTQEGVPRRLSQFDNAICGADFVPQQPYISFSMGPNCLLGAQSAETYVVDIRTSKVYPIRAVENGYEGKSTSAAWSPDGKKLSITQVDFDAYNGVRNVYAWTTLERILAGEPAYLLATTAYSFNGSEPTWSSDNRYLAHVMNDHLEIFDTAQQPAQSIASVDLAKHLKRQDLCQIVEALAWSPNDAYIGLSCSYSPIIVYDVVNRTVLPFDAAHPQIHSLHWSPDSRFLSFWSSEREKSALIVLDTVTTKVITATEQAKNSELIYRWK